MWVLTRRAQLLLLLLVLLWGGEMKIVEPLPSPCSGTLRGDRWHLEMAMCAVETLIGVHCGIANIWRREGGLQVVLLLSKLLQLLLWNPMLRLELMVICICMGGMHMFLFLLFLIRLNGLVIQFVKQCGREK